MREAAERKAKLDRPRKDGTLRDHLLQVYKSTGELDPLLEEPDIPEIAQRAWETYWQIRGGEGLTYGEIAAYCAMVNVHLAPWEVRLLREIDAVVQRAMLEKE